MRQFIVSVFLLVVGTIGLVLASDPAKSPSSPASTAKSSRQAQSPPSHDVATGSLLKPDSVVKQITEVLLTAYAADDAKTLAASFTAEGEYIDAKGTVFHGRKAIEDEFASFFRDVPGTVIEIEPSTTRLIATGVISSDCATRFKRSETAAAVPGHCQLVCTRDGDKWLIASLREVDGTVGNPAHHAHVSQLEWLIGEWIGEGPRSHVHFSCRWDEGGNFLLRDFSVQLAGGNTISGTERIGYDPISGHLKIWVFDSAGGYSDGFFTHDGDTWVVRTSGVTSDGFVAATTSLFSKIDDHRVSSELIDRSIAGQRVGQAEKMVLVRKPPSATDRTSSNSRSKN